MRALIQRVSEASVHVHNEVVGEIQQGLLVLVGIETVDTEEDVEWVVNKLVNLRIFNDDQGKMNASIQDTNGSFLVVSQFTLHASTKKGNRPSYIRAARPEVAIPLYEDFIAMLRNRSSLKVACGQFGADMKVVLVNNGPVTIMLDSRNRE